MIQRMMLVCVTVACVLLSIGCRAATPVAVERARTEYQQGNYVAAYRDAARFAAGGSGRWHREAAYTAGLAAYRLNDYTSAWRQLQVAAESPEPEVSGSALAQLGLMAAERGQHELAARKLKAAVVKLTGEDRARACFHAGVAMQKLGRDPEAREYLSLARSYTQDANFRKRVADQLGVTGFTLQVGAYRQEANAKREAQRYASLAASQRLGAVEMMQSSDGLYRVQVGRFSSYATAAQARTALGADGALIVQLGSVR